MLPDAGAESSAAGKALHHPQRRLSFILTRRESLRLNELWTAWVGSAFTVPATWVYPIGSETQAAGNSAAERSFLTWSYERSYRTMDWAEEAALTTHTIVTELVPARFETAHGTRLLCAIAAGNWILRASYLRASTSAGHWLDDEPDHEWAASVASLTAEERLVADAARWWREALQRGECERLVQRQRVYLLCPAAEHMTKTPKKRKQSPWTVALAADQRALEAILRSAGAILCGAGSDPPAPTLAVDLVVVLDSEPGEAVAQAPALWSGEQQGHYLNAITLIDGLLRNPAATEILAKVRSSVQSERSLERCVAGLASTQTLEKTSYELQQSPRSTLTRPRESVDSASGLDSVTAMELEIVDAGDRSVGDDTLRTSRRRHPNANPPNDRQQPRNQSEESSAVKLMAESLLDRSPAKESGAAGHRMETYIDSMDMEQGSNTTASAQREAHEDPDIEEPSGLSVCEPELSNDPAEDIAFDAPRLARSAVVHQSPIAVDSHSSTTTTTPWNTQSQPSTPALLRASPGVEGSLNQCPSIATAVTGRANRQPRQRVDLMDSPPGPVHDCDLARNCSQADQSAEASPTAEPASPFDEFDLAGLQRARNLPADAQTSRLARLPSLRKRKRRTRPTRLGDKLIFSFDGTAVPPEGEIIGTCALLQTLKREDRPEADDDLQDAAHASTPACDLGDATSMNAKKPRASCDEPCEIQSVTFGLQFESQLQKPARLLDVASTSASATRDAPGLQETARKEGALLPAEAGVAAGSPASSESMDITESPDLKLQAHSEILLATETSEPIARVGKTTSPVSSLLNVSYWLSLTRAFEQALTGDTRQWARAFPSTRARDVPSLPLFLTVAARNMRRVRRLVDSGRLRVSAALEKRLLQHAADGPADTLQTASWLHFDDAPWRVRRRELRSEDVAAFRERLVRSERIRVRGRKELHRIHPGQAVAGLVRFADRQLAALPLEARRRVHTLRRLVTRQWTREAVASWSEAALKAWRDRHENANAYYYRHTDPGEFEGEETQSLHTWTPAERQQFFTELARWRTNRWRLGTCWGIFSKAIPSRCGYQCSNFYRSCIRSGEIHDPTYGFNDRGELKRLYPDREDPDTCPPPESLNCLSAIWQWPEIQEMERQVDSWIRELHPRFALGLEATWRSHSARLPLGRRGARGVVHRAGVRTNLDLSADDWAVAPLEQRHQAQQLDRYTAEVEGYPSAIDVEAAADPRGALRRRSLSPPAIPGRDRAYALEEDVATDDPIRRSNLSSRTRGSRRVPSWGGPTSSRQEMRPVDERAASWLESSVFDTAEPERRRRRQRQQQQQQVRLRKVATEALMGDQSDGEDDTLVLGAPEDSRQERSHNLPRKHAVDAVHTRDNRHPTAGQRMDPTRDVSLGDTAGLAMVQRERTRRERTNRLERILARLHESGNRTPPMRAVHRTRPARQVILDESDEEQSSLLPSTGLAAPDWRLQRLRHLVQLESLSVSTQTARHSTLLAELPDSMKFETAAPDAKVADSLRPEHLPVARRERQARKPPQTRKLSISDAAEASTTVLEQRPNDASRHSSGGVSSSSQATSDVLDDGTPADEAAVPCLEQIAWDTPPRSVAGLPNRRIHADAVQKGSGRAHQSRLDNWRPQSLADHFLRIGQMLKMLALSLQGTKCSRPIYHRSGVNAMRPVTSPWPEHPECTCWGPPATLSNGWTSSLGTMVSTNPNSTDPCVPDAEDGTPIELNHVPAARWRGNQSAGERLESNAWPTPRTNRDANSSAPTRMEDWCRNLERVLHGIRNHGRNSVEHVADTMSWNAIRQRATASLETPLSMSAENVYDDARCRFSLWENALRQLLRTLLDETLALYWEPGNVLASWVRLVLHDPSKSRLGALVHCMRLLMQLVAAHATLPVQGSEAAQLAEPHSTSVPRLPGPWTAKDAFWQALQDDFEPCLNERGVIALETSSSAVPCASVGHDGTSTWTRTTSEIAPQAYRATLQLLVWLLWCREALTAAPVLVTAPACWRMGASALASSFWVWRRLEDERPRTSAGDDAPSEHVLIEWNARALGCCAQLWTASMEQLRLDANAREHAEALAPLVEQALLLGTESARRIGSPLWTKVLDPDAHVKTDALVPTGLQSYDGWRRSWRLNAQALDQWAASTLLQRRWIETTGRLDSNLTSPAHVAPMTIGGESGVGNHAGSPSVGETGAPTTAAIDHAASWSFNDEVAATAASRTDAHVETPHGTGLDDSQGCAAQRTQLDGVFYDHRQTIEERLVAGHFGLLRTSLDMLACWTDLHLDWNPTGRGFARTADARELDDRPCGRGLEQRWLQSLRASLAPLWRASSSLDATDREWTTIWMDRTHGVYVFYLYGTALLAQVLDERERRALYRQLRNRCPPWIQPTLLRLHSASMESLCKRARYAEQRREHRAVDASNIATESGRGASLVTCVRLHTTEWIALSRVTLEWLDETTQHHPGDGHGDRIGALPRRSTPCHDAGAGHAALAKAPREAASLPVVFANRALVQRLLRNRVAQALAPALRQVTEWIRRNESQNSSGVEHGTRCAATWTCLELIWQALPWYWSFVTRALHAADVSGVSIANAARLDAIHGLWTTSGVLLQLMHLIQGLLERALPETEANSITNVAQVDTDPLSDAAMLVDWEAQTQRALLLHELGPSSERLRAFLELVRSTSSGSDAATNQVGTLWFVPASIQEAHAQLVANVVRLVYHVEGAAPAYRLILRLTPLLIVRHGHLESWTGISASQRRWTVSLLMHLVSLASPTVLQLSPLAENRTQGGDRLADRAPDERTVASSVLDTDREALQRLAALLQQRLTQALVSGLVSWPLLWAHEQSMGMRERPASRLWIMMRPLIQTLCRFAAHEELQRVLAAGVVDRAVLKASPLPSWPLLLAWYAARLWCAPSERAQERNASPLEHIRLVWLPFLACLRCLAYDGVITEDASWAYALQGTAPAQRRRHVAMLLSELVEALDALLTSALSWWQVWSRDRSPTVERGNGMLTAPVLFQYLVELAGSLLVLCPGLLRIPGQAPFWSRVIRIGRRALEEYGRATTWCGHPASITRATDRMVTVDRVRLFWTAAVLRGLAQMDLVPNDVYYASFRRHLIAASLEQGAVDALVLGLWPGWPCGMSLSPAQAVSRPENGRAASRSLQGRLAVPVAASDDVIDDEMTALLALLDAYWRPERVFGASAAAQMRLDRFQKEWLDEIRSQCLELRRDDLCLALLLRWQQGMRLVRDRCSRAHLSGEVHWARVASALAEALWSPCMDRGSMDPARTTATRRQLGDFVGIQTNLQHTEERPAQAQQMHPQRFADRWSWSVRLAGCLIEWLSAPPSADASAASACTEALVFLLVAMAAHLDVHRCDVCRLSSSALEFAAESLVQSMNQLVAQMSRYPSGVVLGVWRAVLGTLARWGSPAANSRVAGFDWCRTLIRPVRVRQREYTWRVTDLLVLFNDCGDASANRGSKAPAQRLWLSRPRR